jgi:branched-chain amino acid transport system substrate-binding protein
MRRRFVTAMFASALVAVAGACTMITPGVAPSHVTSSASQDPLGVVTIAPGQPIVLGTLLASTGPAADIGVDSLRGVKLALDYLDLKFDGRAGTLFGHPVQLVSRDDACSGSGGLRAAHALASHRQMLAVIGPTCSATALGKATQILSDAGIITISPSATNPKLTDPTQHVPLFLRTAYNALVEGAAAADFGDLTLKARRASTAYEAEPQGDAATAGFVDRFEQLGGLITGSFAIPSDPTKAQPLLQAMSEEGADLLYTTNLGTRCADLTHVWDAMSIGAAAALVGGAGCMVPAVITGRTGQTKKVYAVGPDLNRMAEGSFYRTEFLPAYETQFGTPPIAAFHAYAYDATDILLDAIQLAATRYKDGTLTIGRSALRDAVFGTKDYQGITGTLSCTPLGECSTDPALAVYLLPAIPLEGGDPSAKPVFSESVSLQSLEPSPTATP